ncbi:MAG TPA: hypothetical protein VNM15_05225 [Candidatus Binatia bacterium]|nr:hypothetical protein [Candidatus Binatia bacterium]
MNDEKRNGGTGPLPKGGGPAPSIDDRISEHRRAGEGLQSGTMAHDRWASELDALYRQKVLGLKGAAMSERDDVAADFEPDPSDLDPESGQPLTEEQRQARAELEELRNDLTNSYGARTVEAIGDFLIGEDAPFKTPDELTSFIQSAKLDAITQREVVMSLGELAKALRAPGPEISHEQTLKSVETQLKSVWGDQFESQLAIAERAVGRVFGSVERFDDWATRNGLTRNPTAQVRAVLALARLGRRIGRR